MDEITLPFKRLDSALEPPAYAYPGDAGLDLRSSVDETLEPFERKMIPCGISVAIPEGHAGLVIPRSGLAAKHGISIVNAPGLVDSGYRGELKVILVNLDARDTFTIARGDRIAQLVIIETPTVTLSEADKLSETDRGAGGFGSSGVSNS